VSTAKRAEGARVAASGGAPKSARERFALFSAPPRWSSVVGRVPTRELVSADGMIQRGINTRVGPMCRTVEDIARVLDVYAGYDPKDELTAFSRNRLPEQPYWSYTGKRSLKGYRIGVIREYMDKQDFTIADSESIDLIDRSIAKLEQLGATMVDPGAGGALFQECVDLWIPKWQNQQFMRGFASVFPFDSSGTPIDDVARHVLRPVAGAAHRGRATEHPQRRRHRQR